MEIFLVIDGQKTGPMTIYEVRDLLRKDKIDTNTPAWVKGMQKWQPLRDCPPFKDSIDIEIATAERDSIIISQEDRESLIAPSPVFNEPKPWLRLWAKLIDIPINIVLGIIFFSNYIGKSKLNEFFGPEAREKFWNQFRNQEPLSQTDADTMVLLLVSICISWIITETLLMSIFSTTLGKWILNIKTSKINGKRIDVFSAFARSFFVLFLGFGFWLFPFLFICPIISYVSLLRRKKTQWDRLLKLEVTHNELTPTRIISAVFSFILISNLVGILLLAPEQISP